MKRNHAISFASTKAGWGVLGLCVAVVSAAEGSSQIPIPLDGFDGWETWPLIEPGGLHPNTDALTPVRIEFEGLFPGPNGFGVPPLEPLTMVMDVMETNFRGEPALWVQWTSRPPEGATGAPALDVLVVDRATFRLQFRIAASQRGLWAGRYEIIQAPPEQLTQVTVPEDGQTAATRLPGPVDFFDFATYQFLFPFLALREGASWRLSGYEYLEKRAEVLPARVIGRTRVADALGVEHDVWRVDIMPGHRATLISFYVSSEPPYFYGWDYRLTRNGGTALKLTLRGWTATAIAR